MSTQTTNLNLEKPGTDEFYDVNVQNRNMDKIDNKVKALEEGIGGITVPVTSVNTKTGAVVLSAGDIKAADGASVESHLAESVSKTLITASNDFIVGSGNGTVVKKTLAETKALLGVTAVLAATETAQGIVELATTAEVTTGTDTTRVITPKTLKDQSYFNQSNYGAVVSVASSITLGITHANRVIPTMGTVTIPSDANYNFPVGTQITCISQPGTICTFIPTSGVSIGSAGNKRTIDGDWASATLIKVSSNTWALIGALK